MTWIISIILSCCMIVLGYIAAYNFVHQLPLCSLKKEVFSVTWRKLIYLAAAILLAGALNYLLGAVYHLGSMTQLKLVTLVLWLLPIAVIDGRLQKIPNQMILAGLWLRCLFYIAEFVRNPQTLLKTLQDGLVGVLIICGFFVVLMFIFKNSIGMGDIKLFFVMGLFQGLWGLVYAVFFSLTVSFVVSIILLATKKKKRTDTISFGPSIFVGTLISIVLTGM